MLSIPRRCSREQRSQYTWVTAAAPLPSTEVVHVMGRIPSGAGVPHQAQEIGAASSAGDGIVDAGERAAA